MSPIKSSQTSVPPSEEVYEYLSYDEDKRLFSEATDVERAQMKAECAKCMHLDSFIDKYR